LEVILKSEAVLVRNGALTDEKEALFAKLLFRMKSVLAAKNNKYILLNAPNNALDKIQHILPGMKSPTILPLAEEGWSSVHSVITEDLFWEKIDELKAAGAEGILIVPIEKMVL
jgi:ATP phosphoribosyltransferase